MRIVQNTILAMLVGASAAAFSLLPSAPDAYSTAGCLVLSGVFGALALGAACLFAD